MNTWTRSTEALTDRLLPEAIVPRSMREFGGRLALLFITLPGIVVILLAAIGPWLAPHPVGTSVALPFQVPGEGYLFGMDRLGRDLWSQILHGGRSLLVVPLVATVAAVAVGTTVGMTMGYLQGRVETVLLALIDVLLVLPPVIVLLVLASGWGGGASVIVLTMILTGAPFLARLTRAATLEVCRTPFVMVSITQGDSAFTILRRDVLPNVAGPVLADSGMRFVGALYLAAALSLLGFGPQPPETNWAVMIRENAEGAGLNLWALLLPASMIALMSISANFILQALADRIAR